MKKIIFGLMAASILMTAAPTSVSATVNEDLVNKSEQQIKDLDKDKLTIAEQIEQKEKAIEEAMLEVEGLEENKTVIEEKIKENDVEIKKAEDRLKVIEDEIAKLEVSLAGRRELVGKRLLNQQSTGNSEYLGLILGSESFMDLLARATSISIIVNADSEIIRDFMKDLELVKEKLEEVEKVKINLEKVKKENDVKKEDLLKGIEELNGKRKELEAQVDRLSIDTNAITKLQGELVERINKELGMKETLNDGVLEWPTNGGFVSSGVGARVHPVTGEVGRFHSGTDIARSDNSVVPPIFAAGDGVVVSAGVSGGYGNMVKIKHDDGKFETLYGHMSVLKVKAGQKVRRGQEIGTMGTTGMSTGIHLHFEVVENGKLQNALRYFN